MSEKIPKRIHITIPKTNGLPPILLSDENRTLMAMENSPNESKNLERLLKSTKPDLEIVRKLFTITRAINPKINGGKRL